MLSFSQMTKAPEIRQHMTSEAVSWIPVMQDKRAARVDVVNGLYRKFCMGLCALMLVSGALAAELQPAQGTADSPAAAAHGLIGALQNFLRQQGVEADHLNADAMVRLMVDWYRFTPVHVLGEPVDDALVYRYGGWSEGCATAFKLSLLRRVTQHDSTGAQAERFAGITLMFEPSAQAELMPFTAVSSDAKSLEAFLQSIESSPAFRELAAATPMGVLVESGGVR